MIKCPFCDHDRVHKHAKTRQGVERFNCPHCRHTFTATFDTIAYQRQVSQTEIQTILQTHQWTCHQDGDWNCTMRSRRSMSGGLLDGLSLDRESGLILTGWVGKRTDELAQDLIANTEGKTGARVWFSDDWQADERQLSESVERWVGKSGTQRLERTTGIVRQQNGRFHRRQNKFREQHINKIPIG
ncbi:IS1 family transposase [Alkalinema pantanalense CENA528]|uniref:IS1 family transposase n=1 Tax=Alkalinema pantanalense TaxID=1620705 RepID=UPI003D6EA08C